MAPFLARRFAIHSSEKRNALVQLLMLAFGALAFIATASCGGGGGSTTSTGNGGGGTGSGTPVELRTEVVASGFSVPWALAFAPDGRLFFTEQPGRLFILQNGQLFTALDYTNIVPGGESGMLGVALDPAFASNHTLYIFYCADQAGIKCRVSSFIESNNSVAGTERILFEIPGTLDHHVAGRIMIHDNLLYVTVGDFNVPPIAQDKHSFNGKILRMTLQGAPAPGNPFTENAFVYSYGHRDPQGLAFDSSGALYSSEHGPVSNDEVNLITTGANYGWPVCVGRCGNPAFVDPVRLWNPETLAPSGATFYNSNVIPQWNGSMLIAALGLPGNTYAHHIHRLKFDRPGGSSVVEDEILFRDQFGRIRDVVLGPDGFVYFSTSNGGGTDRIVRIRPR